MSQSRGEAAVLTRRFTLCAVQLKAIHSENMEDIKMLRIGIKSLPGVNDAGDAEEKAPRNAQQR